MQEISAETKETAVKNDVSEETADRIIRHHVYVSMGAGLIPLPLLDFAALTGIQVSMLKKLAGEYGVTFSKDKVKNSLLSLFGGIFPTAHAGLVAGSLSKLIPATGQIVGVTAMPILSGATTYAVGKLFAHHFAWGRFPGSVKPEELKKEYAELFEEGKKVAADMVT
jgi:uncharacterized protein (DUF697 family)